jgi:hypothetical protein
MHIKGTIKCKILDSHSYVYEEFYLLGYNTLQSVESQPTFRRKIVTPSSRLKSKPNKKLARSRQQSKLWMKATCYFETLVDFQRTTME